MYEVARLEIKCKVHCLAKRNPAAGSHFQSSLGRIKAAAQATNTPLHAKINVGKVEMMKVAKKQLLRALMIGRLDRKSRRTSHDK